MILAMMFYHTATESRTRQACCSFKTEGLIKFSNVNYSVKFIIVTMFSPYLTLLLIYNQFAPKSKINNLPTTFLFGLPASSSAFECLKQE